MDPTQERSHGSVLVLAVCTANICRSPYMQLALRAGFDHHGIDGIDVLSAGTDAGPGREIAAPMAAILTKEGIAVDGFESRRLTRELVADADLILTAAAAHRSRVAGLVPSALPRIFTLRQFARLVPLVAERLSRGGTPAERLLALTELCATVRGTTRPAAGAADDVDDPWRRSGFAYRRSVDAMRGPIDLLVTTLAKG